MITTPDEREAIISLCSADAPEYIIAALEAVARRYYRDAWHAGWEQRSLLGGPPACPSDYYKEP